MTDQEINIAIAEECGWRHQLATQQFPVVRNGMRLPNSFGPDVEAFWHPDVKGVYASPPDYLNDLNAIHQAWRDGLDEQQQWEFGDELDLVIRKAYPEADLYRRQALETNATARQRSEAFLKTVGKWTE